MQTESSGSCMTFAGGTKAAHYMNFLWSVRLISFQPSSILDEATLTIFQQLEFIHYQLASNWSINPLTTEVEIAAYGEHSKAGFNANAYKYASNEDFYKDVDSFLTSKLLEGESLSTCVCCNCLLYSCCLWNSQGSSIWNLFRYNHSSVDPKI